MVPPVELRSSRLRLVGTALVSALLSAAGSALLVHDPTRPDGRVVAVIAAACALAAICLLAAALRPSRVVLRLDADGFTYRGLRVAWTEVRGYRTPHVYRRGRVIVVAVTDTAEVTARWQSAGLRGTEQSLRRWGTPVVLDATWMAATPGRVIRAFADHAEQGFRQR
ncbi:hypothetical protein GCM10009718_29990 [Isoptericola halotolerans]|uniref:PH domain-containing protein n=1 Tax=Isoptericola halotolerans TaxID=300560 RepID=A0ABX2A513_9MICO|nr:hypothetical protein [Isoptericola halotolerans]NOV97661.1 hypothetical protein [Isoptericola halotolerans]